MQNQEVASSVMSFLTTVQNQKPDIINIGICDIEQDAYFLQDGTVSSDIFLIKLDLIIL